MVEEWGARPARRTAVREAVDQRKGKKKEKERKTATRKKGKREDKTLKKEERRKIERGRKEGPSIPH